MKTTKKSSSWAQQVKLSQRIERVAHELEKVVPELKAVLGGESERDPLLASAAKTLERAAGAVRALVEGARPGKSGFDLSVLEGTSPLMSMLGSRIVLSSASARKARAPSVGARALAVLLEDPGQSLDTGQIAERLGCPAPTARTTLNRLVRSGHAVRSSLGRFKAKRR